MGEMERVPVPAPAPEPRRRLVLAALACILALAAGTRLVRCGSGLPYLHDSDETLVAGRALDMLKHGRLNPEEFNYGPLTYYLYAAVDVAHYLRLRARPESDPEAIGSRDELRTFFDSGWRETISHPSFYFWNRAATALLGLASLLLTYAIGRELAGAWAGVIAAAWLSGVPLHVVETSSIGPEVPGLCASLAAMLAGICCVRRPSVRALALSCACAGLAFAFKMNYVIVAAAPAVAAWEARRALGWRALVRAGLALPAAMLLGHPWWVLDGREVYRQVKDLVVGYANARPGPHFVEAGPEHLGLQLRHLAAAFGPLATGLGALGALALLRTGGGRVLIVSCACYAAGMARMTLDFERNFIPLYPALAVAAGVALHGIVTRARGRWRIAAWALVVLAAADASWRTALALREALEVHGPPETRSRIVDEVNELAAQHGWRAVGVDARLDMHPLDVARIAVDVDLEELDVLVRRGDRLDAVVTAREYDGRGRPGGPNAKLIKHLNVLNDGRVLAEVDGDLKLVGRQAINPAAIVIVPVLWEERP
jgi:4-amino-4-deoxy-L-arabinose transferase-like glycosyltransferase